MRLYRTCLLYTSLAVYGAYEFNYHEAAEISSKMKITAFMGNKFQPVFGQIVYRNMRRNPIVPKELKRLSDLAPLDKDKVQLVAHRGLSGA